MQFPERPTVYLDVSQMMGNRLNTGIQRVVRNLARVGPEVCAEFRYNCRLVHAIGGHFYRLRYEMIDNQSPLFVSRLVRRSLGRKIVQEAVPRFSKPLQPLSTDLMITLNATWDQQGWCQALEDIKKQCHTSSVVYDLIPITAAQFHTPDLCQRFSSWFAQLVNVSHHLVGISRHVRNEIDDYLQKSFDLLSPRPTTSYFRLGTELLSTAVTDAKPAIWAATREYDTVVRPALREFLGSGETTLLSVGTIEPRKNHAVLLAACQKLWQQGWAGRLLLIGRIGWKNSSLCQAIQTIPDSRLLHLQDAGDSELRYAYGKSSALVFPSWEEGFGLPLVEALQNQLPVIVSDIPIHREVAGGYCQFFSPDKPEQLISRIVTAENDRFRELKSKAAGFQAIDWKQSFHLLLCDAIVASRGFVAAQEQSIKHGVGDENRATPFAA